MSCGKGAQQKPMCRAKLPDSAEKMFADAHDILPAQEASGAGRGRTVESLNRRQQRQWTRRCGCGRSAEQGLAEAQYNLGLMYQNGQGVDVN